MHTHTRARTHTAAPLCKALTAERDADDEIKGVHLHITAQHLTRGLSLLCFCDLFGLVLSILFTFTKSIFFVIQLRGCLTGITIRLKIFSSNAVSETQ